MDDRKPEIPCGIPASWAGQKRAPAPRLPKILLAGFIALVIAYMVFSALRFEGLNAIKPDLSAVSGFVTVLISILMQAFPFMLVGVCVSSALHVFVPDDIIVRAFPTRHGLGFLTALLAGVFFPVCECAVVPVASRLVKKGVAPPIAVTFMLAAPIVNPISILSTLYAFAGQPRIAALRVIFGLFLALMVGLFLWAFPDREAVPISKAETEGCTCGCGDHDCIRGHDAASGRGLRHKLNDLFLHIGEEFFGAGRYLVLGALAISLMQAWVPRRIFLNLAGRDGLALLILMAGAFLISACSTSDAFIARSFADRFPMGAVMGFLVFGPMIDVKNLFMLLDGFPRGFVLRLSALIFAVNFVGLYMLTAIFF
jgi:uncharacterized membrane protein YraQ (UPF0718 family)